MPQVAPAATAHQVLTPKHAHDSWALEGPLKTQPVEFFGGKGFSC
jgi:hypothetical protein